MSNLNRTTLIGRVGGEPRVTSFQNGSKAATFSLATSKKWKDAQGNQKEQTEWHNVVVYGKKVDTVEQYVKKGDLLLVEGRGQTRTYTVDGVEKSTHETVVADFEGQIGLFPKARKDAPAGEQPEWAVSATGAMQATKATEIEGNDGNDGNSPF